MRIKPFYKYYNVIETNTLHVYYCGSTLHGESVAPGDFAMRQGVNMRAPDFYKGYINVTSMRPTSPESMRSAAGDAFPHFRRICL
jgi:hypothetical protein